MELMDNDSFCLFAANGNSKHSLIFCEWKMEMEACVPWSAKNKW